MKAEIIKIFKQYAYAHTNCGPGRVFVDGEDFDKIADSILELPLMCNVVKRINEECVAMQSNNYGTRD